MIQNREQASAEAAIRTGQAMLAAAITAPKGNGVDDVNGVLLTGEDNVQWYGQLMTRPQTIAYFVQLDHWMERFGVKVTL